MAKLNVEDASVASALQSYGHTFSTVEDAKDYLARNGGGTIAIVPDEWDIYETQGWQEDFDYECDREILIVVEREDQDEVESALNSVMTAAEIAEEFGLSESTVRQAINRNQIAARKSAGTWLVLRKDAEKQWG